MTKSIILVGVGGQGTITTSSILSKGLIEEVGRKDTLGRPILYGTTELFLRNFSLENIDQLPNRGELSPDEEDFQV